MGVTLGGLVKEVWLLKKKKKKKNSILIILKFSASPKSPHTSLEVKGDGKKVTN